MSALYELLLTTLQDNATKPPATYQSVARALVAALLADPAALTQALVETGGRDAVLEAMGGEHDGDYPEADPPVGRWYFPMPGDADTDGIGE